MRQDSTNEPATTPTKDVSKNEKVEGHTKSGDDNGKKEREQIDTSLFGTRWQDNINAAVNHPVWEIIFFLLTMVALYASDANAALGNKDTDLPMQIVNALISPYLRPQICDFGGCNMCMSQNSHIWVPRYETFIGACKNLISGFPDMRFCLGPIMSTAVA